MGWGEARATLLSPRWRGVEVESPVAGRTLAGSKVRLFATRREPQSQAQSIRVPMVRQWLECRGFTFDADDSPGLVGQWEDVQADLFETDGELSELELTFKLVESGPHRWPAWQRLADELGSAFGFRLADHASRQSVPPNSLLRVLSATTEWQDFGQRFGWPAIPEPTESPELSANLSS